MTHHTLLAHDLGTTGNKATLFDAEEGVAQEVQLGRLLLIGGGARSAVWRQILADVLEMPVWLPALTTEATALGAVVAGGVGVGLFADFSVVDRLVSPLEN